MFIWLIARTQNVLTFLYSDPDLGAFSILPLRPDAIFRWQLQKFWRASGMSLVDLVAALGAFGWFHGFTWGKWAIMPFIALLSWVTLVALAFFCAARWPRRPYGIVPGIAMLVGSVCFFGRNFIGKHLVALINGRASEINLLLPTGWPLSLFGEVQWFILLLLVPIGGVIWTINGSLARLREKYEFTEITTNEASDIIPDEVTLAPLHGDGLVGSHQRLGVTAIEEIVLSRQCFAEPKWRKNGRFEGLLWDWFSAREKALAEFVFPDDFAITTPWRKIFRNLFIAALAAFTIGLVSPVLRLWVMGLGLFVTICQALAQILGTGQAFQPTQCSGVNIPVYAAYAIGFRELASLLFKCSLVQFPLFVPFIAMCATLIASLAGWPLLAGVLIGVKAGVLLLASRFITVTFAFSSGTNDTARFQFRSIALFSMVGGLGLLFLAASVAAMFVPVGLVAWSCFAFALLDAYILFRMYGWFYHANRFDLMKPLTP